MAADLNRVQAVFLKAVEIESPAERAAILADECGTDDALRLRVNALLKAHDDPASFMESLEATGAQAAGPSAPRRGRRPWRRHRPVQTPSADRRGRLRRRLHGRAGDTCPPHGCPQDHQGRHGHGPGDRPLRVGAASPGDHGSPQHCQSVRCRRHQWRARSRYAGDLTSSWSW